MISSWCWQADIVFMLYLSTSIQYRHSQIWRRPLCTYQANFIFRILQKYALKYEFVGNNRSHHCHGADVQWSICYRFHIVHIYGFARFIAHSHALRLFVDSHTKVKTTANICISLKCMEEKLLNWYRMDKCDVNRKNNNPHPTIHTTVRSNNNNKICSNSYMVCTKTRSTMRTWNHW